MQGYLRQDGRKGIRNVIVVIYLVECAHHVARRIVDSCDNADVQLIGFSGCYPNEYALRIMQQLGNHPNVGGVVLLSLGCEGFNREALSQVIRDSGRPVETVVIQENGGTQKSIDVGVAKIQAMQEDIAQVEKVDM
ncbi:UxaA family hydrolase, partial [Alteromonas sp. 14N.309.X.WAT.G.H12]|uniref:UxaA family hydrolase n=1 Tax=Alteromonas sp. 14N.309.X.WAT.G.H12 TaxID=3120824 RepID=UPI002FD12B8E